MSKSNALLFMLFCIVAPGACLQAQDLDLAIADQTLEINYSGFVARVDLEKADDLLSALRRAEAYYQAEGMNLDHPPVVFVVYGPPVAMFFKKNYQQYSEVVDLAAKLTALKVIDVKVCKYSFVKEGLDNKNLLPFVSTVPFGPDEVVRLIEQAKYRYF
jgi:intracellular sulfur oxidation DsrE/DsrF family protein